jgi:hypothetical protein
MNISAAVNENFDTAFVARSRNTTVMMPGMSESLVSVLYSELVVRRASYGFVVAGGANAL